MRRTIAAVLLTALGWGCSQPEPLLSIKGRLKASSHGTPPSGPLTMAIAWYPEWSREGDRPGAPVRSIDTQKIVFRGSYPRDFTFALQHPPPDGALADLAATGGSGRVAYGVLMAFDDRNDDRALWTITSSAPSPDRLVGLSMTDPSAGLPFQSNFVVYLEGAFAPDHPLAALKLEQGYNLVRLNFDHTLKRISPDAQLDIELTDTDALGLYACEEADFRSGFQIACGIDPYGGQYALWGTLSADGPWQIELQDGHGRRAGQRGRHRVHHQETGAALAPDDREPGGGRGDLHGVAGGASTRKMGYSLACSSQDGCRRSKNSRRWSALPANPASAFSAALSSARSFGSASSIFRASASTT